MSETHVGFTGTSGTVTEEQGATLRWWLGQLSLGTDQYWLHHGDCIGADALAHEKALMLRYKVVLHPPSNPSKRAWCEGWTLQRNPLPYLERNREIVKESDLLVACPDSFEEKRRSGTWATIRYAREAEKRVIYIWPDGTWLDTS